MSKNKIESHIQNQAVSSLLCGCVFTWPGSEENGEQKNHEGGFTLIELLVATAVMAVLATSLMLVIEQVSSSLRKRMAQSEQMVNMHTTAVAIEGQLQRIFLPGGMAEPTAHGWEFTAEAGHDFEPLLTHTTEYEDCLSDNFDALKGHDSLLERSHASDPGSDRRAVTLSEHKGEESAIIQECALRRSVRAHTKTMLDGGALFAPHTSMGSFPMGDNIDYFQLRFYDSETGAWVEGWDSTSGDQKDRIPGAVEYSFRIFDPEGRIEPRWFRGMLKFQFDK